MLRMALVVVIGAATACDTVRDAACSSDHWCEDQSLLDWDWRNERPALVGVHVVADGDVWVVGDWGWMLHRDPSAWDFITSGTGRSYYAIDASTPTDLWGVGQRGLVQRLDGTQAVDFQPRYDAAHLGHIFGLVSFARDDVWASAYQRVFRFNGQAWIASVVPNAGALYAIAGTGPEDVWVVSDASVHHWDGARWVRSIDFDPDGDHLNAVEPRSLWAGGANDVWAGGLGPDGGIVAHYRDGVWTVEVLAGTSQVTGVWGTGAGDIWATSDLGLHHFDGSTWSLAYAVASLAAVTGFSPTDIWAAGGNGIAVHFDGSRFEQRATGVTTQLLAVAGVAADDVWVTGESSQIAHWDGRAWTRWSHTRWDFGGDTWEHEYDSIDNFDFEAIAGQDRDAMWFAGFGGLLRYDGQRIAEIGGGAQELNRYAVAARSPSDVWSTGDAGGLYHFDGTGWVLYETEVRESLFGVAMVGEREAWAVGDAGRVMHWDGTTWTAATIDAPGWLRGVWGSSANDVWIVGEHGALFHYDGALWQRVDPGTTVDIYAVWGRAADDVYAVGDRGTMLHFDGTRWLPQSTPTTEPLIAIEGSDNQVWAVGGRGCDGCGVVLVR